VSWLQTINVWSEEQDSRGAGELDAFARLDAKSLVVVKNRVEALERCSDVSAIVVANGSNDPSL